MSQPLFEILHIELSNSIGDSVTSYLDDGKVIPASKRTQALNDAIQSIYERLLSQYLQADKLNGYDNFLNDYPEFRDIKQVVIASVANPHNDNLPKDSNVRKYVTGSISYNYGVSWTTVTRFLDYGQYISGLNNTNSAYLTSQDKPRFFEFASKIDLQVGYGHTAWLAHATIDFIVLMNYIPVQVNINAADVVFPFSWKPEVISLASQICESWRQS